MDALTMEVSTKNSQLKYKDEQNHVTSSNVTGTDAGGGGGGGDNLVGPPNAKSTPQKDDKINFNTQKKDDNFAATILKFQKMNNAAVAAAGGSTTVASTKASGLQAKSSPYHFVTAYRMDLASAVDADGNFLGQLQPGGVVVPTNGVDPLNPDGANLNGNTYNLPALSRFLSPQFTREKKFDIVKSMSLDSANTAMLDGAATAEAAAITAEQQARKQLFDRQFRQVEMGCPAGFDCYSRKVFVGGLPPDIDETAIEKTFCQFGPHIVDWPHKPEMNSPYPPKGFVFLLFYDDSGVRRLIEACTEENGHLYMNVSSQTMKDKPVEVRPWRLADADYIQDMNMTLDPRKTVFIGGVPRPIKAYELAMIMNRLFGRVCYAGIDTDPDMKYPKGAGRVTFFSHHSYVAAISARFVQLQHQHIDKRVEIKPYVLDDQQCDECKGKRCNFKYARFFCSNTTCLRYYCDACWTLIHTRPGREYHKPLIKEYGDRPRAVPYCWHFIEKNI